MPLMFEPHDSLPYIDPEISEADRQRAKALIVRHLPKGHTTTPHPSLAPLPTVEFSDAFQQEVARAATGQPSLQGIDTSRYEVPDEPSEDNDQATTKEVLRNAYTSNAFLSDRRANLQLLDEFGKNAWLVGNAQTEEILNGLERELAGLKSETESVNKARKQAQEQSKGELLTLQENWKRGVGKILEIQVGTDQLRHQFLAHQHRHAT